MSNIKTPEAKNWNNYWSLDQTQKFTQISWSKRRIMRIIRPYLIEGRTALDAGCGSGWFTKYFCDLGLNTVALDYSQEALDIAKEKTQGRARLYKKDLLDENFSNAVSERFDFIFSDGLLEHFSTKNQVTILSNLKNVLKDDGIICTFVPNRWSPWELIRPFYMPGIEEEPFILKDLVDVHHSSGLQVLHKGGINTIPFQISPDRFVGQYFGMLLYVITKKQTDL